MRPFLPMRFLRGIVLAAGVAAASGGAMAGSVTVFAASSLKTALDAVSAAWTAETGHEAVLAFAGSSALARQIERGAPADVFISANRAWMDRLEAAGHVAPGSRIDLLTNTLVLIAHGPADPIRISPGFDLGARLGDGRLAMALVDAVPAGMYGKAALEALGVWSGVAPRVAQANNVRAALALVAVGEAPLGIVYETDAAAEDAVSVIGVFPPDTHPTVVYPAAAIAGRSTPLTEAFLAFLRGDTARTIFESHGFGRAR